MSIVAKVIHKDSQRRFSLPADATWEQFQQQLQSLFGITQPYTVTYQDEDNETITISTGEELKELIFLRQALATTNAPATVRFTVTGAGDAQQPPSYAEPLLSAATDDTTRARTADKQKEKLRAETDSTQQDVPNPFAGFEKLAETFQSVLAQHPELTQQTEAATRQFAESFLPFIQSLGGEHGGFPFGSDFPFGPGGIFGGSARAESNCFPGSFDHPGSHPYARFGQRCGFGAARTPRQPPQPPQSPSQPRTEESPLTAERVAELVEQIKSMGFYDEQQVTDLIKRYDGRMERVIEVLVQST